jgi:hypothetical protein
MAVVLVSGNIASMFERFTIRAIKAIMIAQEAARAMKHNWVGYLGPDGTDCP